MRALCIITLWIFGACSDVSPQLINNELNISDDITGIDISEIDNARTQCIIGVINKMFAPLCMPVELTFNHKESIAITCRQPNAIGCTLIHNNTAYVYTTINAENKPLQIYSDGTEGDIYVHELTHVQSYCVTGDVDSNHKLLIWADDLMRKISLAKQLAKDAGCYRQ